VSIAGPLTHHTDPASFSYEAQNLGKTNFWAMRSRGLAGFEGNLRAGAKARMGLFIDEKADERQRQALQSIFAGEVGGRPAGFAASIGEFRGVEFVPISFEMADELVHWQADVAAGPFYNYNKTGKPSEAIIENWWRQGMMGGAKAHYDGIVAFSQTDFTEDLKKITVPVLVMHSEDDQIVPYVAAGPLSAKLLKNGTLKT
jgi:pimeloyl-ACP methyl ester carboxylesterase